MSVGYASNPKKALLDSSVWPDSTITQDQLNVLCREYHVYDGLACGTTPEAVLAMACLDITLENIANEVMVIFEPQLKCGLRIPPPRFLTRLCEIWGVSLGQLAPNTIQVVNAFCLACHLSGVAPLPDVLMQFYRFTKRVNHPMFSLMPVQVKVDNKVAPKVGGFAECKDSWESLKSHYVFLLRDNS